MHSIVRKAVTLMWLPVLVSVIAQAGEGRPTRVRAGFEFATPYSGAGVHAVGGPWSAGGPIRHGFSIGRPEVHVKGPWGTTNGAVVDPSGGLEGTGAALRLSDVDSGSVDLFVAAVAQAMVEGEELFLEYVVRIDPTRSGRRPDLLHVGAGSGDTETSSLLSTWLGLVENRRGDVFLRYNLLAGTSLEASPALTTPASVAASDEWRVRIRIDAERRTQRHELWKNGVRIADPILGVPHPLAIGADTALTGLRFATLGFDLPDGVVEATIDEIRVTTLAPPTITAAPGDGPGHVKVSWNAVGGADGYVVQRRRPDSGWASHPIILPGNLTEWDDAVGDIQESNTYRVATLSGGEQSVWSQTAAAIPVAIGKPLYGWLNVNDFASIQEALDTLTGDEFGMPNDLRGPHVLWFPNGVYDIAATLHLEAKAGVQLIGESAGGVVLRWVGPAGSGPDDVQVLFHMEGSRDVTFRNMVWDAGCAAPQDDPTSCYVVAFEQSFCGVCTGPDGSCTPQDERSPDCDALPWEDPTVGKGDVASAHFDSVFRNAHVGLRIGRYNVIDAEVTVRRCRFEHNFAGVAIEYQNALNQWFWDSWFESNVVGITANTADSWRRLVDGDYRPSTCALNPQVACWNNQDCPAGDSCKPWSRRGGDFHVFRGRFIGNLSTDIWHVPGGHYTIRDSWSAGSGRFLYGSGQTGSATRLSLIDNVVWDYTGDHAIVNENAGTLLLAGNTIYTPPTTTLPPVYAGTFVSTDILAVDNRFTLPVGNRYTSGNATLKLRAFDVQALLDPAIEPVPTPPDYASPAVFDPLSNRPVYTVDGADAASIQAVIDAALADPAPAIVHFPSRPRDVGQTGFYPIDTPLTLPAGSDLILVGDGAWTVLQWQGGGNGPILNVDGSGSNVTLRDLQFKYGGVLVEQLDQPAAAVLLSQTRVSSPGQVGIVLDDLDRLTVDVVDYLVWSSQQSPPPVGLLLHAGDRPAGAADPAVAIWSGSTNNHSWDFDVVSEGHGAEVLISSAYSEHSLHYLRVRGAANDGQVTVHSSNMSLLAELGGADLERPVAAVLADDFPGDVAVIESRLRILDIDGCCVGDAATDTCCNQLDQGVCIEQAGGEPTRLVSMGNSVEREDPEADYLLDPADSADFLRVNGKFWSPNSGLPTASLADLRVDAGVLQADLSETELANLLDTHIRPALAPLRDRTVPAFYDESVTTPVGLRLDKVFFWYPPEYGLLLAGGTACADAAACDDGIVGTADACVFEAGYAGVPGRCRSQVVGEGYVLSRLPDYSTDDRVFSDRDTLHALAWSERVDPNSLRKQYWELRKGGDRIRVDWISHGNGIYESLIDLSGLPTGVWTWKSRIEDANRNKFSIDDSISIEVAVGCVDDAECNDGDLCNGTEVCVAGSCQAGTPLTCDDGIYCNGAEICDSVAGCLPGGDPCPGQACDETLDSCLCDDATACDDGLFCNGAETCGGNGECVSGTDPCTPGETCNEVDDRCSPTRADVITILVAEWKERRQELKVVATSSGSPAAQLTVLGFSELMRYDSRKDRYTFTARPVPYSATVTVVSDLGGEATAAVVIK